MSDADIPMPASVARSELVIAGVTLIVHQLDNGQRIIERDGLLDLLDAMAGGPLTEADAQALARAVRS